MRKKRESNTIYSRPAPAVLRFLFLFLMIAACTLAVPRNVQAKSVTKIAFTRLTNVMEAPELKGNWEKTSEGWKFRKTNGKYAKKRWIRTTVDGKTGTYYLNKKGVRARGWLLCKGNMYYAAKDGHLLTGWHHQYYFDPKTGAIVTGLKKIDGKYYYFSDKTFRWMSGFRTAGTRTYYFSKDTGEAVTGWITVGDHTYYARKKGYLVVSSWLKLKKKKYHFDENGYLQTGDFYIDDKWCHFGKDGVYDPKAKIAGVIDPSKPMVALTFDDGPGPYTERLLNCLERNHAKATFFMVGYSVPNYPATVQHMVKIGCELGNHSYDHPKSTSLSSGSISSQFSRTSANIFNACGKYPTVCRLPYGDGAFSSWVLASTGLPSIYWSVDTRDWANTGNPQHTINEVLNTVKNGDIVLKHDIHSASVTAAETVIPALISRGYQLVTVSELAKYKGKTTLSAGTTYRSF